MAAHKKKYSYTYYILLFYLLIFCTNAFSQSNFLHKKINCSLTNISLGDALDQISQAGGFTFSYNSKNFDISQKVSLNQENISVGKSLDILFEKTVHYKVVGSHVVLIKKNPQPNSNGNQQENDYIITGYIIDSQTGEKIKEATIYEVSGEIVTLSDSEGFYSLTVPANKEIPGLSYSKKGYLDTVIIVEPTIKQNFNVRLSPQLISLSKIESKSINVKLNDLHNRQVVDFFVPYESKVISDNLIIRDTRKFQVSLIPYVGTNYKLSGSVDNNYSFNVLSGYSGGINGFELGGILNIVRRDVNGAQISGVMNMVGGNTKVFQLAGMFNLNSGSVTGVQVGGFSNVVLDTISGVQIAGFNNTLHGHMNGIQLSGFNNLTTQHVDGVQLTGFANVALKDVKFAQLSGFANYGRNIDGIQLTGFANVAVGDVNWGQAAGFANYGKSVKGYQVAGFANVAIGNVSGGQLSGFANVAKTNGKLQASGFANIATEEVTGVQITSCLNYTKKVKGIQIALINIADTIESGMSIGLISFIKNGFHRFELSADENSYENVSYKLGHRRFYNIIKLGYDFSENLYAGYGIGTQFYLNPKFNFNIDLISSSILTSETDDFEDFIGNLNKIFFTFDYTIFKKFTIFLGPTISESSMQYNTTENYYPDIAPYSIYTKTYSDYQIKMWVGGIIGLSFKL